MRLLLGVLRLVRAVLEGAGSPRMLGVLWIGTFVTFLLINQQNKSLAEQIFFAGMFMAPVFAWFPAFVLRVILRQFPALPEPRKRVKPRPEPKAPATPFARHAGTRKRGGSPMESFDRLDPALADLVARGCQAQVDKRDRAKANAS